MFESKDYIGILLLVDGIRKEIRNISEYQDGTQVLGVEEVVDGGEENVTSTSEEIVEEEETDNLN